MYASSINMFSAGHLPAHYSLFQRCLRINDWIFFFFKNTILSSYTFRASQSVMSIIVMPHLTNPTILAISLPYRCARCLPAAPSMDYPWTLSLDNSKNLPFVVWTLPTGMGKEVVRNPAQLKKDSC